MNQSRPHPTCHWLQAGDLEVAVSPETGAVVAVRHGDWAVLDRSELGRSFRLLVPSPDQRSNFVDGREQDAPNCSVSDDGRTVTSTWDSLVDEHGAVHPIRVRTRITGHEDRIVFGIEVENTSELVVENVYFPDLGDIRPAPSGRLDAVVQRNATGTRSSIWPNFPVEARWISGAHYYSNEHPFNLSGGAISPRVPWTLLEDGSTGLYVGVDEPSLEPVTWFTELLPGYKDSLTSLTPIRRRESDGDEIGGHAVSVHFAAVHLPFIEPGERRILTPIAMAAYTGDWHAGVDFYTRRRAAWDMPTARPPAWARDPHSWLQLHINSSEGERRIRFAELPDIAAECVKHGVTAIQLTGWQEGGLDSNYPCHDADQRLGGAEALRDAISTCQQLGVKVVLFTKFVWADRSTERFRRELVKEAVKDLYGDYYVHPGYPFQTITQLLDINTKRLVPMCFLSERWLQVCQEEFAKVVELGADGMLFDEAMSHGQGVVCFDESHQHRRAAPVHAGDRQLFSRFRQMVPDDYLFACEAPYDWLQHEAYQLGYLRSWDPQHLPVSRYLRPDAELMTALTGFDDRNMVNQSLLYRYVMSYEPFNYKGRASDAPDTLAYGRLMDELRTELREWFWDASFIDTVGVAVRGSDGSAHHPYSAFRHRDGRTAVAVANYSDEPVDGLSVSIDGQSLPLQFRLVDDPEWHICDGNLAIPPRSAAVLIPAS